MVDLELWYEEEKDGAVIVGTPAELDTVLDIVAERDGRVIVDVYVADNPARAAFNVGIHGKAGRGALYYAASQGEWFSKGAPSGPDWNPDETILYYLMNSDTEYSGDCEVPLDVVRRAAHEFMTTGGERPAVIEWQPRTR